MSRRTARTASGLALAALVPLLLSGCGLVDAAHHQTSGTADSVSALRMAWRTPASEPDWVPADATRIRFIAVTAGGADASPAAVRVTTTTELPRTCTEIERRSLDAFGESWAPRVVPDRVERCGNWAVVQVRGGWFGWTPLAPAERTE